MSTNGTCIEPNYVVPGANPCRADNNPDNLVPSPPTHIQSAVPGITEWTLSFTEGQFATSNTCFVTLPDGSGTINGFCSGNFAYFFGLTANTAYIATITSVNQFGSTPSSPPFPFTTGINPGQATSVARSYCDIAGKLQISYTPAPNATSHTALMTSVSPNFNIVGIPTATPNYFTFTGYPVTLGVNYNVTIVITSTNIYGSEQSVPLITTTFSPQAGSYVSPSIVTQNFFGPYSSSTAITLPSDFAVNVNSAAFAKGFATLPVKLTINGIWGGNTQTITWNLTTTAGNGVSCSPSITSNQSFTNQILPWTANVGTLTLITGMTPGGTLNTQISFASGVWLAPAHYTISFTYNQGIGTLTP
jgi:hypothetical protein